MQRRCAGPEQAKTIVAAWPINEILLDNLVARGKSDCVIAQIYGVDWKDVRRLRQEYWGLPDSDEAGS